MARFACLSSSVCAGAFVAGAIVFALGVAPVQRSDGGLPPRPDAPKVPAPTIPGHAQEMPVPPEFAGALEFMTPGPEHEWLARKVGAWTAKGRMWAAPNAPAVEFNSTSSYRMILGGRFLVEEMQSEMMGQPFEAMGLTGFDRRLKEFQVFWLDSMGTAVSSGRGTRSADGNVFTFTMRMFDPMLNREQTIRGVETIHGDDAFSFQMFGPSPEGGEMKTMEIEYTRIR